jgi:hypothetical protein
MSEKNWEEAIEGAHENPTAENDRYTESELMAIQGDHEGMPAGKHFKDPGLDLVYRKEFLENPDKTLEALDQAVSHLVEKGDQASRDRAEYLATMKEAFIGKHEQDTKWQKGYDKLLNAWKEAPVGTVEREDRYHDLMNYREGRPVENRTPQKRKREQIQEAQRRAHETGDYTYLNRLMGV